jgi:hypothetical protein
VLSTAGGVRAGNLDGNGQVGCCTQTRASAVDVGLDRVPDHGQGGPPATRDSVGVRPRALWVLPTIPAVMTLGIGLVLSQVMVSSTRWFVVQGTPDDARTLLIAISNTWAR